jgi:hypothetical protein
MRTTDPRELLTFSEAARALDGAERARAVEGLYATGHWLLSQERFADAADVIRVICIVSPGDERGWVALGAAHEGAGHLTVAKEIYATGCTVAQQPVRCELALARVLKKLDEPELASEAVERAALLAGDDESAQPLVEWERSHA